MIGVALLKFETLAHWLRGFLYGVQMGIEMPYLFKSDYARWRRIRRKSHAHREREIAKRHRKKFPEKANERWRKWSSKLPDYYVRRLLSDNTNVPPGAWPSWLVELKRLSVKLKRHYGFHSNNSPRVKPSNRKRH